MTEKNQDHANLIDYWRVIYNYRSTVLFVATIMISISTLFAVLSTPIYRTEILLSPAQEDETSSSALAQLGGLASIVGLNFGSGGSTEESLAVLKSKAFLDQFIKDKELLPILFKKKWDSEAHHWKVNDSEDIPSIRDAYEFFTKYIFSTSTAKDSGLVTVSLEWSDPKLIAAWANELINRLNDHQRRGAIAEGQKSIEYLEKQLRETSVVEMQQTLYRLIESETQKMMIANVREEYAFKVIDPAVVPEKKVKPKRAIIITLGGFTGLMLGIFLAFFRSFIKSNT